MPRQRKLESPITLFAAIEAEQHEILRKMAFEERRSIADIVRESINEYVSKRTHNQKARSGRASAAG